MTITSARSLGRSRPSPSFVAVSTIMLAVSTGVAACALWPSYRTPALIILVLVSIFVGSLIAILGAIFRWSSLVVLVATVIAYLILGVPLAVPSLAISGLFPSFAGLGRLLLGTATSWKELLTIGVPVGSYQALLIPAFTLILVTVVVSLTVALRAKYRELAVLGPIIVYLVASAIGPEVVPWPIPIALCVSACVLIWLHWSRWYRRREAIRTLSPHPAADTPTAKDGDAHRTAERGFGGLRSAASVCVILAIASTAAIAMTHALPPAGQRVVLRTSIVPPFNPRDYPSPLSGFRKYLQDPDHDRTMFTVSGLPTGTPIRLATLDSYDGVVYSVGPGSVNSASGVFSRVPLEVDQSDVNGSDATIRVTIGGYSGVWLPTVGALKTVTFDGSDASNLLDNFYFNANTNSGAVVGGLEAGDTYTLSVVLPRQPGSEELSKLEPGAAQLPPVEVVPDELASVLDGYVEGVDGAGAQLVAMLEGLRRNGYVSHGISLNEPASRSGHSADRITELLTSQRMIGDEEQYAVTAALMARQIGFPARVVFGFAPTDVVSGAVTFVTGSDVSAWIEVDSSAYGWVTIDPTPPLRPIPEEEPEDPASVALPQSPVQPQLPHVEPDDTHLPPNSVQDDPPAQDDALMTFLRVVTGMGLAALVMVVLLSPFLTIAIAKWRRRRLRRIAPTPLSRISGGWDEFEDAVIDHGFTPGPVPTRLEVAQVVGGTQPFVLAAVADRAVFSPAEPDAEEADQLWRSVDELRYYLDAGLTRWERVKAIVSLRSLGGNRVTKMFQRDG